MHPAGFPLPRDVHGVRICVEVPPHEMSYDRFASFQPSLCRWPSIAQTTIPRPPSVLTMPLDRPGPTRVQKVRVGAIPPLLEAAHHRPPPLAHTSVSAVMIACPVE